MTTQGHLHLNFRSANGRTILDTVAQQPPLKVIRSFPITDGGSLVHLHNVSGGILSGDMLIHRINIFPNAYAQLTSTSATRVYRSRVNDHMASQVMDVHVQAGGLCEYVPDPLIPFAGSRYMQKTRITLDDGAGLFWWEIVAPGREAHGENFAYSHLQLETDICAGNMPLALERVRLTPPQTNMNNIVRLGGFRYWATFYICRIGTDNWLELEESLSELAQQLSISGCIQWGCSTLPAHGLIIRALAQSNREIMQGLPLFWQAAKQKLYGRQAIIPRKIY
jgi:urease accessory protein